MANDKILYTDIGTSGILTLSCQVQRVADGFWCDNAGATPGEFYVAPVVDADLLVVEGPLFRYITTENRVKWNDGLYRVWFWDSATAKPIASDQIEIINDAIFISNYLTDVYKSILDAMGDK